MNPHSGLSPVHAHLNILDAYLQLERLLIRLTVDKQIQPLSCEIIITVKNIFRNRTGYWFRNPVIICQLK